MSSLPSSVISSLTASAPPTAAVTTTTTTTPFSTSAFSPSSSFTMSSPSSSSPAPPPTSPSPSRTSTSSFVSSTSIVPPPSSSSFSSFSSRSTLFSSSIPPLTSTPTFSSSSPTPSSSSSHSIPASSVVSQSLIPPPTSTLSAPIFVTVTDNRGALTTSAPSAFTTFSTSTANNGKPVTVTQIIANPTPTLSPNNTSSKSSTFFKNTGAVAGVFVLVGLAAVSILLWIFFAVRRRRRTQRLEHDTAVSATLAAAGFHRAPLDDDDDPGASSRRSRYDSPDVLTYQRRSTPSAGAAYMDAAAPNGDPEDRYNPYTDYIVPPGAREGYVSGDRASTPPTAFHMGAYHDRRGSGSGGDMLRHSTSYSGGSYEPLLANYRQTTPPNTQSPSLPPRNPKRLSDAATQRAALPQNVRPVSAASSVYSSESTGDDRLDPGLRQRMDDGGSVKDEEDYSRPVLGVRNLPDDASLA